MQTVPRKILCVGQDSTILRSQCATLETAGYAVCGMSPADAEASLKMHHLDLFSTSESFDLVILSLELNAAATVGLIQAVRSMPILILAGLTHATDLLLMVQQQW
jgi:DNA-binding response OmpR family regulator